MVELTVEIAASAMTEMQLAIDSDEAADFFYSCFRKVLKLLIRQLFGYIKKGTRKKHTALLSKVLIIVIIPIGLAALSGMDKNPKRGLDIIRDVNPDTPRYYAIKGNLFRATDQPLVAG